jgi:hypothetical protein
MAIRLEPGKFYRAIDGRVWCCYAVADPQMAEREPQAAAFCIPVHSRANVEPEYFYIDGRYDSDGKRSQTLITECGPNGEVLAERRAPLTFARLSETNLARCEAVFHPINDWTLPEWGCAMAGEAGEACNVLKKIRRLDKADKSKDTSEERARLTELAMFELADVVTYVDLIASALHPTSGSLETYVRGKFNKVSDERGTDIKL